MWRRLLLVASVPVLGLSPGRFQFFPTSYAQSSQWGSVRALVSRALGSDGAASVLVSSRDGTALQSLHYVPIVNQTLSWADGVSDPLEVSISFVRTAQVTQELQFYLDLHDSSSTIYMPFATATITIQPQNVYPGDISFSASTLTITIPSSWDPTVPYPINVPVQRLHGASGHIQVPYSILDLPNAASPSVDFAFVNPYPFQQVLDWGDQDSSVHTIPLVWLNQALYRQDMVFGLQLAAPTHNAVLDSPATIQITVVGPHNAVPAGIFQLLAPCFPLCQAQTYAATAGSAVRIYVQRQQGSVGAVSVAFLVTETNQRGTVTWADTDVVDKSFVVSIPAASPSLVLHVVLQTPTNLATINAQASATTITVTSSPPFLGGEVDFVQVTSTETLLRGSPIAADSRLLPEVATWDSGIGLPAPLVLTQPGTIPILIRRARGSVGAATVQLQSIDGTAIGGVDYVPINTQLSWADGQQGDVTVSLVVLAPPYAGLHPPRALTLVLSSSSATVHLGPAARLPVILQGTAQMPRVTATALDLTAKTLRLTFSTAVVAATANVAFVMLSNPSTKTRVSLTPASSTVVLPQLVPTQLWLTLGHADIVALEQTPGLVASTMVVSVAPGFVQYDVFQCQTTQLLDCAAPPFQALSPVAVAPFTSDAVAPTLVRFTYDQQYVTLRFSNVMDRASFVSVTAIRLCDSILVTRCVTLSRASTLVPRGNTPVDVIMGPPTTSILTPQDETLWTIWVSPADVAALAAAAIAQTPATSFVALPFTGLRDISGNGLQGPFVLQQASPDCSACPGATFLLAACTDTTDRVCSACTVCGADYFAISPCTPTHDTACTRCRQCHWNLYASQHCTPTQDRVCAPCTKCTNDQYEFSPCTTEANRVCLTCDSCVLNLAQQAACKFSVAFERRKRSPYGCPIVGTEWSSEEIRLQDAKSNTCGAGRCSCTGNGVGNANPNGFSFPDDPRCTGPSTYGVLL
ncbi:Aste57867_9655 [Aphanomyces stellatus]|uniref:Aste57867_9655 protein n=1 Tax=Aphanomyces stellatus TaxID=120398 RepID=A0A485KNR1_9STRA|nr:hypothetical protein As57867_009617 [Aphanomyces stellatus]VFT86534.1 Aste57867_9655 [Aphanomyces stellatus]